MSSKLKKIAVFTSGGDSPGMNAAIRAVTRSGIYNGLKVTGVIHGYTGLINGEFIDLNTFSVSNIIQRGGTILKSSRSEDFKTKQGRKKAFEQLQKENIDALVAIGGDGTFTGAQVFYEEYAFPIIGIPGTIDNDLYGTDHTLGYDSAINTAMNAIDNIRDTAASHDRLFFVEVMGRDVGFIALRCGIAGGAKAVLVPETKSDLPSLMETLENCQKRNKTSMIVVVSEGDETGGAFKVAEMVKKKFNHYDTRVSVIGHMQRGGKPTCADRVLASRLGVGAVEALLNGEKAKMIGVVHRDLALTNLDKTIKHHKEINRDFLKLVDILSS
jgi:6-phosphofructokinase 1